MAQVPELGPPTMELLNHLLHEGIEQTLKSADEWNVLQPPYGHKPPKLPVDYVERVRQRQQEALEEEEEEDEELGDMMEEDEESVEEEPPFHYHHGFNAVLELGRFLRRNNPKNVRANAILRQQAFQTLKNRAAAALATQNSFFFIQQRVVELRSGILLGPLSGDVTARSARLWCRSAMPGRVVFELSATPNFAKIVDHAVADANEDGDMAATVWFEDLEPQQTYFYRVCTSSSALPFPGPAAGFFRHGKFQTCPSEDVVASVRLCMLGAPLFSKGHPAVGRAGGAPPWAETCAAVSRCAPDCVILNGGLVPRDDMRAVKGTDAEKHAAVLRHVDKHLGDGHLHAMLARLALVFSWNDDVKGASAALRAEEHAKEKMDKESKRRRKKPWEQTADLRPNVLPEVKALASRLPVELVDDVTRHFFKRVQHGQLVDVLTLDTRARTFGKAQTEWLCNSLLSSPCVWKFVVVPNPLGYGQLPATSASHPSSLPPARKQLSRRCSSIGNQSEGVEQAQQERAAIELQKCLRGRLLRKLLGQRGVAGVREFNARQAETRSRQRANGGGTAAGLGALAARAKQAPDSVTFEKQAKEAAKKSSVGPLVEIVADLCRDGVEGLVVLTTDPGHPFALEYAPGDPEFRGEARGEPQAQAQGETEADATRAKPVKLFELGVAPLGPSDPDAGLPVPCAQLNPTNWLFHAESNHSGVPTFGLIDVAGDTGVLTFTVCDDKGNTMHAVSLDPPPHMVLMPDKPREEAADRAGDADLVV